MALAVQEAKKKAAKAARQAEKTVKSAKKKAAKGAEADGEAEDDIEKIMAALAAEDAKRTAVHVAVCERPSPRANCTLTVLPSGECIIFGGELWDGRQNQCFNDLYRVQPASREWRSVSSPNTPPHRCSHQAVLFNGGVYVFGGEFATNMQFYHYQDTWRFDIATNRWLRLECKRSPSARSGHRMLVWRSYIVLFGGFHQSVTSDRWFGDVWLFDTRSNEWKEVVFPSTSLVPAPRSGMQFCAVPGKDIALLYGGYSEVKPGQEPSALAPSTGGKGGKGGGAAAAAAAALLASRKSRSVVHTDMWVLKLAPLATGGTPTWERVRYAGSNPSPRLGFSMSAYKDRLILFGGVADRDADDRGELVESEFFNETFSYDVDRRRWYKLELRREKAAGTRRAAKMKRKPAMASAADDSAPADDDDDVSLGSHDGDVDADEEEFRAAAGGGTGLDESAFYFFQDGKLVKLEAEPDGEAIDTMTSPAPLHTSSGEPHAPPPAAATEASPAASSAVPTKKKKKTGIVAPELDEAIAAEAPVDSKSVAVTTMSSLPLSSTTPSASTDARPLKAEAAVPCARMKAVTWMDGHWLFVYGGMYEGRARETTLDDLWRLDLRDRSKWECLMPATEHPWFGDDSEEESEDDEDEDDSDAESDGASDDSEDSDDSSERGEAAPTTPAAADAARFARGRGRGGKEAARIREIREQLGVADATITPLPGERLRDFFARTADTWIARWTSSASLAEGERVDGRTIRRNAFELSRTRYDEIWPMLEELYELEAEQKRLEEKAAAMRARPGKPGRKA